MPTCDCENRPSPHLLRFLRAYKPRLRKYVGAFFAQRLSKTEHPTIEQIQDCIASAYEALLEELEDDEAPAPDENTLARAIDDYNAGRWQSVEDVIDEIPG